MSYTAEIISLEEKVERLEAENSLLQQQVLAAQDEVDQWRLLYESMKAAYDLLAARLAEVEAERDAMYRAAQAPEPEHPTGVPGKRRQR